MRNRIEPGQARADRADGSRVALVTESFHLRSYDHRRGYDLEVEVESLNGEAGFERRYYLQPGQTVSELDAVPSGAYEVRATMDNCVRRHLACRIDSAPEHTVVIEVGNGALSLTEGLAG